jgi:hypothetical protein
VKHDRDIESSKLSGRKNPGDGRRAVLKGAAVAIIGGRSCTRKPRHEYTCIRLLALAYPAIKNSRPKNASNLIHARTDDIALKFGCRTLRRDLSLVGDDFFLQSGAAVSINLTTTYRALSFSPARIGIVALM